MATALTNDISTLTGLDVGAGAVTVFEDVRGGSDTAKIVGRVRLTSLSTGSGTASSITFRITHDGESHVWARAVVVLAADAVSDWVEFEGSIFTGTTFRITAESTNPSDSAATCEVEVYELTEGGGSAPTASAIADAVLLEQVSDHSGTSGSLAQVLSTRSTQTSVDAIPTDEVVPVAGVGFTATGFTATLAGTPTGDVTNTYAEDGQYHVVPDDSDSTAVYYEFAMGSGNYAVQVHWSGYAQTSGESYDVSFWNWSTTAWEKVGVISGATGTTNQRRVFNANLLHTGTSGGDAGKVRLRFSSGDGDLIATDRIVCHAIPYGTINTSASVLVSVSNTLNDARDGLAPIAEWTRFIAAQGLSIGASGPSSAKVNQFSDDGSLVYQTTTDQVSGTRTFDVWTDANMPDTPSDLTTS